MNEKLYRIIYFVLLLASILFMIFNLTFNLLYLNFFLLVFFWAVKFLSGFGILLSIANVFLIVLKKFKERFGKKELTIFNIIQIVVPLILIIYATYQVITSFISKTIISQTGFWFWFGLLIYLYGILSLLLNLYILPIIRDEITEAAELGKLNWWKRGAKKVARGIKKKYFELKKEYASAQVQDQMTAKEILDLWRNKFALNFLLIIGIGSIIFTPITLVCIIFWFRVYIFFRSKIKTYEKISLLISLIFIGVITLIFPFLPSSIYINIANYYWTANLFYLIGIVIASIIFVKKLLSLQGITIAAQKIKRREKKIEELEEEKEELKRKLKEKENSEE
jgi:MFS family permease